MEFEWPNDSRTPNNVMKSRRLDPPRLYRFRESDPAFAAISRHSAG